MRGVSVEPTEPWTAKLPSNIKFKIKHGSSHGPAKAFYNAKTEELVQIVFETNRVGPDKWVVLAHDTKTDNVREEKMLRKVLPKVKNEIVRVYSGDASYAKDTVFEEEVPTDVRTHKIRRRAEEAMVKYMKENAV